MFPIIEFFLISYLIGSIPTAYIAVRKKSHIDIRSAGSGNVGTMNAYEVTGSRVVGIFVLAGDVVKGAGAVLLAARLPDSGEAVIAASFIGVVLGHCYPVWLKFRGGRGLAPAAGAMLILSWPFVAMWLVWWIAGYSIVRNIHLGNAAAIVATPLVGWMLPSGLISKYMESSFTSTQFLSVFTLVSALLLARHAEPIRELFWPSTKNGT